jgi:hypothetical protein
MTRKFSKYHEESARIRRKIDDYNKYQWLVFIPLWVVTIVQMVFPARTIPIPEIYILLLDVAAMLFSITGFIAIRLQIRKLKEKREQLEESEKYTAKRFKSPRRKT